MYSKKYTLEECRTRIIKLLQRYSSNGIPNSCGEIRDIENRFITSLNIHLDKLWYEFSDARCKKIISFFRPEVIADFGSMSIVGGEIFSDSVEGCKLGFYIQAKGKGKLTISNEETTSDYFIDTEAGAYSVVTGVFDNTSADKCDFVLSAESTLEIKEFYICEGVETPELLFGKETVASFIPENCSRIISLTAKADGRVISPEFCLLENERIITIPAKYCKDYTVEYLPYPPNFSDNSEDSAEFYMSPVMFDALCYLCASDLCPANDNALYTKLTYKYREILENIYDRHRNYNTRNKFYGVVKKCRSALSKYGR